MNAKKQVLIVGAGKRAQGAIIPALLGLSGEFEIAAIYARHVKEIRVMGEKFVTINNLDQVDFLSLDFIMVAVTLSGVPDVLRKLAKYNTKHIRIMLDTPVVRPRDIFSLRLLKNFRRAQVSEDSIVLAPFIEAKRMDRIKDMRFIHSGYRYHALAAMKMLTGTNSVKKITNKYLAGKIVERHFVFPNGARGVIVEPRDYSIGKLEVVGENGRFDYDFARVSIEDLKNEGLKKLISDESLPYSVADGVYDYVAIAVSEKLERFFDFQIGKRSLLLSLIRFTIHHG